MEKDNVCLIFGLSEPILFFVYVSHLKIKVKNSRDRAEITIDVWTLDSLNIS